MQTCAPAHEHPAMVALERATSGAQAGANLGLI